MIEFKFSCPSCGQHIQASDAYSGHTINCPVCAKAMTVPPPPTSPRTRMPAPSVKKSRAVWVGVGAAIAVILLGTATALFLAGKFSRGPQQPPAGATARTAAAGESPGDLSQLTAAEILHKVTAQYESFTSYSARGKVAMVMDMSGVDTKSLPGMERVPASARKSPEFQKAMNQAAHTEGSFTIKLGRPDFYRIEWETKMGPASMKGAAWSAGKGDFLALTDKKYTKLENRALALASATGVSGGAAGTLPMIFYNESGNPLQGLASTTRDADEPIDGTDCFVLKGEVMGLKTILWVTKDNYLLKQKQIIFGGNVKMPEASDEKMDAELAKMKHLTPEQREQARAAAKKMGPLLSQMKGTATETYEDMQINPPVQKADFEHPLAAGAQLSPTLF